MAPDPTKKGGQNDSDESEDDGQSIAESESVVTPDRDEFADDEQLYRLPIAASSDPEWNDGGNTYGVSAMLNMASSQHKNHLLMVPNSHLLVSLLKVVYPHESSIVNLPSLQSIQNTDPCSDPLIHESDPDAESDSNNVTSLNVGEQLENDTILGSFAQPNAASLHFQPSERPPSMGQCTPITSGFTTTTEGKWERPYVLAEVSTPRSSLKPFVAQFDKHSPQPDQSSDYDSKTEEDASFRQSVTELDEYEHIVEGAHNTDVQYFTVHSTAMEESEYQSYESDSAYTSEAVD